MSEFIIKESPGKGFGVFANSNVPEGTEIYSPDNRVRFPRSVLEGILSVNGPNACRLLLAWGWGEGDDFVLPLGIESFINHSDTPNMGVGRDGVGKAKGLVKVGEELVENYNDFDKKEGWYCELARRYGAWIA